ncbi:hypothetical protein [Sphingomonas sp. KR3-1]|uniref:hypothetical protein n=1 Tax=Sphingomonas sp. KR3-1 TaxID=3156611 RepID=UPI0032B47357
MPGLILTAAPAGAQDSRQPVSDPGIVVTGQAPACRPADLACLNAQLKLSGAGHPTPSPAREGEAEATTPSRVGTFSQTATAQRMGRNFGKAATPYRPPAPSYSHPAGPVPR